MTWITWEKRLQPSPWMAVVIPILSVILALGLGAIFLAATGFDPWKVYQSMLKGVTGSRYGISETVVKAIPLMLTGLGVSVAFRMLLWNIGAEGQFYMGAFGATWVALTFPHLPPHIMLPAMFIVGCLLGGLWAVVAAIPRAKWGVNEVITTLMLNYVAILWVDYLVYGPWKDPQGFNFPLTAPFAQAATLATIPGTRVHLGLVFALIAGVLLTIILWRTRWGYEIRVIGESVKAARYAGMNIQRNIILVMFLSGALAGLAGMSEVSGVTHRLQHAISPGYGYTAIIIAWLAKLHPATVILVSFLFAGLIVGGYSVQTMGVPAATVSMLQGAILFFVLGGEILTRYRLHFRGKEVAE
ncbi:MAG: ABC transporter permease [Thermoanaerobacteraceae bacterium]|uniref:ABC transporter permease n=1 Tax=Thermanaeromonas sp. C210 TaxID=2731925 RepID=UPI00155CAF3A|nr:ABC transporter permease [Thermanaeromonas sp. C210]MBE3580547.1 ABC transporter permease [Thermoanaerobacteraceae bacterium]GFN22320.1 ABC transporter permease [Thermanaeromonas sp. C210]